MLKVKEFSWIASDGLTLYARAWFPDKPSGKVILLVHGLGEHCGRYEHWAGLMNAEGHAMLSFDQRGHGRSEGKRGHASSLIHLLNDINLLYEKSEEIFPGQTKILYGHSMGGNLVLNFMIRQSRPVSALIVTSPWLKLYKPPGKLTLILANLLKDIIPSFTLSNRCKPDQLSHDHEAILKYTLDPLVHARISFKLFHEIHYAGIYASKNIFKINCPVLIMHGNSDTITSSRASQEYVMNTTEKVTLRLWENQFHELHNELIYKEVFDYARKWIEKFT